MPRKAKGPNGETLPPGLYWDGKYFRIRPLPGYPRERAGKHKGRALQLLEERRAQIQSGTARTNRQLRANTLDALAALWKRDKADKDMRSLERAYGQYQQHISPRLGKREPDSVRPREVLAVLWDAYERDEQKRRALNKLGAKSVHNLKATLSSIYSFGVFEELVETNVCRAVPKDKLPKRGKPRRKGQNKRRQSKRRPRKRRRKQQRKRAKTKRRRMPAPLNISGAACETLSTGASSLLCRERVAPVARRMTCLESTSTYYVRKSASSRYWT